MRAAVQRIGNSAGIILPKPVLTELGVSTGDALPLTLDEGKVILMPAEAHPRAGWADAAQAVSAAGDDILVWPKFPNEDAKTLEW